MVSAPDNTTTQAQSRTAILGYLAAAAAGQLLDRASVATWFEQQGLAVRDRGLRDALALRLTRPGEKPPKVSDPGEADWIRVALDFDATKLDLDLAVATFPVPEHPKPLMDILRSTERVIRLYEGYDRDLVALIAYDGPRERQRLQTLLEEHEPRMRWMVVRGVDESPAAATWLSLARKVATEERLLGQ